MAQPTVAELAAAPLFGGVKDDDWPALLGTSTRVEMDAHQPIFLQGEPADAFYVVLSGSVEVRARSGDREQVLATLSAGAVLGETSLLLGGTHSASVYAAEDCTLLRFPKEAFMAAVNDGVKGAVRVLYNIAHTLAVRLRAADAHISELAQASTQGTVVKNDLDRLRNIFFSEWN
jgi:CRP-like cAMP-binding protein